MRYFLKIEKSPSAWLASGTFLQTTLPPVAEGFALRPHLPSFLASYQKSPTENFCVFGKPLVQNACLCLQRNFLL